MNELECYKNLLKKIRYTEDIISRYLLHEGARKCTRPHERGFQFEVV